MKVEIGKSYFTRDGLYVARIISMIGSWSKKHPVVGELCEIKGKKNFPSPGIFNSYEHWTKDGIYLEKNSESSFDLVRECEDG